MTEDVWAVFTAPHGAYNGLPASEEWEFRGIFCSASDAIDECIEEGWSPAHCLFLNLAELHKKQVVLA